MKKKKDLSIKRDLNRFIRKGEKVVAISGNDKGASGEVLSRTATTATVQGLNIRKRHVRKSEANPQGGVVSMEKPIHISNLMLADDEGNPIKVKVQYDDNGNKQVVNKKTGTIIRTINKSKSKR